MRFPSLAIDGWQLLDGEEHHRWAPATFSIPPLSQREGLRIGDFAKLMFEIAVEDRLVVERMWVLVTARNEGGYIGVLDNDPTEITENDELWSGTELPFGTANVIAIMAANESSVAMAGQAPRRRWS